ncbi:Carbonic anhydrase, chloroplastic [Linum grandiflorum]
MNTIRPGSGIHMRSIHYKFRRSKGRALATMSTAASLNGGCFLTSLSTPKPTTTTTTRLQRLPASSSSHQLIVAKLNNNSNTPSFSSSSSNNPTPLPKLIRNHPVFAAPAPLLNPTSGEEDMSKDYQEAIKGLEKLLRY